MDKTAEHLHERYSSMDAEELADIYHAGGLTDLAVSVLKEVITSRGLDWTEFITPLPTDPEPEPESLSDWDLWKSESNQVTDDEIGLESKHEANGTDVGAKLLFGFGMAIFGVYILGIGAVEIYRIGNWQLAEGTIAYVSEEQECRVGACITFLNITYSYSVGPKTYSGVQDERFYILSPPSYKSAMPIRVYYDAANPDDSIVGTGAWHRYWEIAVGLLILGSGVMLLRVGWTGDRN